MANVEINDLAAKVTPLSTDEIEIQATAGGASNKATLSNITKGLAAATTSVQGAMSAADKTKINGIEAGATADQTNGEIKIAYEANADTNAFTDAEQTKLTGIESGATTDQSNAEIKTAYEANADTNAFDDAAQTKLSGVEALADVTDVTNVGAVANGKNTIWIPAGAMRPTVSNGCASIADVETTAGRPDLQVLDFDATADEHAQFQVAFPKQWNEGTVTFQAFWTVGAAVTTGVAWALQAVAVSNDDTIDVAYGTPIVVTDVSLNAANDMHVSAESAAITIAGTPAVDDMAYFRVLRDVSDAADDMTQDARLIGIKLFYTTDALNDA